MSAQDVQDNIRRDAEDGLLPPLFRDQQQLDFKRGMWAAAPLSASSAESPSVFIGGLHSSVTQVLLAELCMQMGPLDTSVGNPVRLLKDQRTGLPKGVAFCDFARAESAHYAVAVLHDFCLAGQRLRVNPSGGSPSASARGAPAPPSWGTRRTNPERDEHAEQGGGRWRDEDERRDQRAPRRQRRSRSRSRSRAHRRDERDSRHAERERWGERDGGRRAERWTERDDRADRGDRGDRGGRDRRGAERDEWRGR